MTKLEDLTRDQLERAYKALQVANERVRAMSHHSWQCAKKAKLSDEGVCDCLEKAQELCDEADRALVRISLED